MKTDINIDNAIDSANSKLLAVSVSLPEKIPEILRKNDIKLREEDCRMIINNLSDVLLGIMPIKLSVESIVDNAIEFEDVSDALSTIYAETFKGLEAELKSYPINTDPGSQIFIENMFSQIRDEQGKINLPKPNTAQILSGSADEPIADIPHADAKQVLNEIENPVPTVAQPDFVLPKSKPSTADILRGFSSSSPSDNSPVIPTTPTSSPTPTPPATSMQTPITPSFSSDLDLSTNTDAIIDPFKASMPAETNAPAMPNTAAQSAIAQIMGSKLSDMTGTAPKESFKVMPLSETMKNLAESQAAGKPSTANIIGAAAGKASRPIDPYREPIE